MQSVDYSPGVNFFVLLVGRLGLEMASRVKISVNYETALPAEVRSGLSVDVMALS
jgi:hypothetical protein